MDRRWGYATEQRLRDDNQDTFGVFRYPRCTVAVVADGMGSHLAGGYASSLAVRTLHDALAEIGERLSVREALIEAVKRANQAVFDASRRNHRLMGMGTTIAAVAITDTEAHVVHVGDSRVYLVRGNEAAQLTRDHTMVNLFVEAELLSPEDAASHPEAHVLSRSLGVERQVEVDAHEPIPVEYADTFVVVSDGVHGFVTDWELGNIDWSDPQDGSLELLRLVAARDGDDNASVCAVISGEFEGNGRAPTLPPMLEEPGDPNTGDKVIEPPPAPRARSTPAPATARQTGPGLVDIPATPAPPPPRGSPVPAPNLASMPPVSASLPPQPSPAPAEKPKAPKAQPLARKPANDRTKLYVGVAVGLAALFAIGAGIIAVSMKPQAVVAPAAEMAPAEPATAAVAVPAEATPEVPPAPVVTRLFAPTLPEESRRLPHRAKRYLQPPPGGPDQLEALQASREKDCDRALMLIEGAMTKSIDHASLYIQAWTCFNDSHQRPLQEATVDDITGFRRLLPDFEGAPNPPDPKVTTKLPPWFAPPTGGIEYRLDAFDTSGDKDLFADVMIDRLGDETVADHLLRDLWLEATAAQGLSRLPEQTPETTDWWARRVYVVSRHMNGSIGEMLRTYRPDAVPALEAMLADALKGTDPAIFEAGLPKTAGDVPLEVLEAWGVGMGKLPIPGVKPVPSAAGGSTAPKKPRVESTVAPLLPPTKTNERPRIIH